MSGRWPQPLDAVALRPEFFRLGDGARPPAVAPAHPLVGRQGDDAPPQHPAESQDAAHLAVEQVGGDGLRDDGAQVRGAGVGKLQLRPAVVGASDGSDAPVRPRQRGGPLDGVVAVLGVTVVGAVEAGPEVAVGGVSPAHVLDDVDVPALGQLPPPLDEAGLVVRRPLHDDGEPAGRVGPVHVGPQRDAVPQASLNVALHDGAPAAGGWAVRRGHSDRRAAPTGAVPGKSDPFCSILFRSYLGSGTLLREMVRRCSSVCIWKRDTAGRNGTPAFHSYVRAGERARGHLRRVRVRIP